jgi:uncharacterized protein YcfL
MKKLFLISLMLLFVVGCKEKLDVQERPQIPDYASEASLPSQEDID